MNRKIHFILLFCGVASTLHGQSTNVSKLFQSNLKKADQMYDHLAYRNALELYRAVVQKDSTNFAAKQRIADCYFRLGNMKEAEYWYARLSFMLASYLPETPKPGFDTVEKSPIGSPISKPAENCAIAVLEDTNRARQMMSTAGYLIFM